MNVVAVTPQSGKVSRVNAVAPAIEAGHVYLPDPPAHPQVTGMAVMPVNSCDARKCL